MLTVHENGFKIGGKILGIGRKGNYKTGKSDKTHREFKTLKFVVQTAPNCKIGVEITGWKQDKAQVYNSVTKQTKAVPWDDRNNPNYNSNDNQLLVPDWDKVDKIVGMFAKSEFDGEDKLRNGDSIMVTGSIEYSVSNGKVYRKLKVNNVYKPDEDIDFEAPNFKEINQFSQGITFVNAEEEDGKVVVTAYVIKKGATKDAPPVPILTEFVCHPEKTEFAKLLLDFNFGDTFKIEGVINNRVITVEQDSAWGKSEMATTFTNEWEISCGQQKTFQGKLYSEEDFDVAQNEQEAKNELGEESEADKKPLPWSINK